MAMDVKRVDVWAASISDKPGSLAGKLAALAKARANLGFVVARRTSKTRGVVFVTPLETARQQAAARKAGFKKSASLRGLRLEGPDKPGIGARVTAAVAEAGINLRGLSAASIGKRFVCHLAFDKTTDATKAGRILKRL